MVFANYEALKSDINHISPQNRTTRQQMMATRKRPSPDHAAAIPMRSAKTPANGVPAASIMAGTVITARVT